MVESNPATSRTRPNVIDWVAWVHVLKRKGVRNASAVLILYNGLYSLNVCHVFQWAEKNRTFRCFFFLIRSINSVAWYYPCTCSHNSCTQWHMQALTAHSVVTPKTRKHTHTFALFSSLKLGELGPTGEALLAHATLSRHLRMRHSISSLPRRPAAPVQLQPLRKQQPKPRYLEWIDEFTMLIVFAQGFSHTR